MKKILLIALLVFSISNVYSQKKYKPHQRMYSNDIPSLQIVGVAMSENLNNARTLIQQTAKVDMELNLDFPILVEYPCSFSGSAVSISANGTQITKEGETIVKKDIWDIKSSGGFTWDSEVARLYKIDKEQAVSMLVIDRQGRIRAIANTFLMIRAAHANRYAELIEYLLLNINGNEELPYDLSDYKTKNLKAAIEDNNTAGYHIWEFGEELERRQKEKHGDIHIHDKLDIKKYSRIYSLLGKQAPDFELPAIDGSGLIKFSELSKDKVTVLVVFWAGRDLKNRKSLMQSSMALNQFYSIEYLWKDWTKKDALIGKRIDPLKSAIPIKNTNKEIVGGYEIDLSKNVSEVYEKEEAPEPVISKEAPPPLPSTSKYYLAIDSKKAGPFDIRQVNKKIQDGVIDKKTLCWKKGMVDWTPVAKVPELNQLFSSEPPPLNKKND